VVGQNAILSYVRAELYPKSRRSRANPGRRFALARARPGVPSGQWRPSPRRVPGKLAWHDP